MSGRIQHTSIHKEVQKENEYKLKYTLCLVAFSKTVTEMCVSYSHIEHLNSLSHVLGTWHYSSNFHFYTLTDMTEILSQRISTVIRSGDVVTKWEKIELNIEIILSGLKAKCLQWQTLGIFYHQTASIDRWHCCSTATNYDSVISLAIKNTPL